MPSRLAPLAHLVPDSRRTGWRRLRRRLRRHRRLLAAAALASCLAAGLRTLSPPTPVTVAVSVAAHDLPGGSVLRPADLTLARLPPSDVPSGALDRAAAGRTLAGPIRRGEPVTDVRVIGARLFASLRPGMVATPVRLADSAVGSLLQVGDVIDVLAAPADPATSAATTLAAAGVRVLAVPPQPASTSSGDGTLVLLATTRAEALALAGAATADRLSITWPAGRVG